MVISTNKTGIAETKNGKDVVMCENCGCTVEKDVCKGDHTGHICLLVSENKLDKVRKLVGNPQHICFNCGRVADSDKNLCNPMPL
jgi:hypothetical protein